MRKIHVFTLIAGIMLGMHETPVKAENAGFDITVTRGFNMQYPGSLMVVSLDGEARCELGVWEDCVLSGVTPGVHKLEVAVAHWLKKDEHIAASITVKASAPDSYSVGYGCERLAHTGSTPYIATCNGNLFLKAE